MKILQTIALLGSSFSEALDPSSIVNTLLNSLTNQAQSAISAQTESANAIDTEQLSQEIEALKQAQSERDAAAAAASASSTSSTDDEVVTATSSDQYAALQASLESALSQLADLRTAMADAIKDLKAPVTAESAQATTKESEQPLESKGFIIKVSMPTDNQSGGNSTAAAAAAAAFKRSANATDNDAVRVSLKVFEPISPISDSSLSTLKARLKSDLMRKSNSRSSRAVAKNFEPSIDEAIKQAQQYQARFQAREKFYDELVDSCQEELRVSGKAKLASKIESGAAEAINFVTNLYSS